MSATPCCTRRRAHFLRSVRFVGKIVGNNFIVDFGNVHADDSGRSDEFNETRRFDDRDGDRQPDDGSHSDCHNDDGSHNDGSGCYNHHVGSRHVLQRGAPPGL